MGINTFNGVVNGMELANSQKEFKIRKIYVDESYNVVVSYNIYLGDPMKNISIGPAPEMIVKPYGVLFGVNRYVVLLPLENQVGLALIMGAVTVDAFKIWIYSNLSQFINNKFKQYQKLGSFTSGKILFLGTSINNESATATLKRGSQNKACVATKNILEMPIYNIAKFGPIRYILGFPSEWYEFYEKINNENKKIITDENFVNIIVTDYYFMFIFGYEETIVPIHYINYMELNLTLGAILNIFFGEDDNLTIILNSMEADITMLRDLYNIYSAMYPNDKNEIYEIPDNLDIKDMPEI